MMRYVTIASQDRWIPAVRYQDHTIDVHGLVGSEPMSLFERGLRAWDDLQKFAEEAAQEGRHIVDGPVQLGPPVVAPQKIICIGLNYRKHAVESGASIPEHPVVFSKYVNTIAAHDEPVAIGGLDKVDYEAELALVIGRRGRSIPERNALDYVMGYMNANDVSERALQMQSGQWLIGKTLDRFLPIGPELVPAEEVRDPDDLRIRGWLNGDLRQHSNTSDQIFSVPEIISFVSRFMTLEPGDIICTGTPEGVVLGMDPQEWVQPGDVYEVEVGPLGRLRTPFVE